MRIEIKTEHGSLDARIDKEMNPKTAKIIIDSLPIKGEANRWGEEIYYPTKLKIEEEKSQTEVDLGTIAYWPPGQAICIFFGRTPASDTEKPKAASPVNIFGKIIEIEFQVLKNVKSGETIVIQ